MNTRAGDEATTIEVIFDGDDFSISPGAARVLLRIIRKAAARTRDQPDRDDDVNRLAS